LKQDDLVEAVRERLKRLPLPYQAHFGIAPLTPPEGDIPLHSVAPRLSAADAAVARIDTLAAELKDPYLVSRMLPRREAVSSSSIEGTSSTLDELLSIEEIGDGAQNDAAVQVRDYALALDQFVPRARAEKHKLFTIDLIRDLHRTVMTGDTRYTDRPGQFRNIVVWIGGGGNIAYSTYNPAPPGDIVACLEQTTSYMRLQGAQQKTQGLILRMAIAHAHFEAVHPFRDGNGRVGRLLLPLMMAAEDHAPLYLSPYVESHKDAYYASLKAAQQRLEWHEPAGFLADAIVGTAGELLATRDALTMLGKHWRERRKFRRGSATLNALDILPHYPVLTIKRLADILKVSVPATTQAVDLLVDAGILTERTGYARNRVFVCPEALAIINRPFGETPVLPEMPK
jgi:cell filamentation protein, protein adenylyltransferase